MHRQNAYSSLGRQQGFTDQVGTLVSRTGGRKAKPAASQTFFFTIIYWFIFFFVPLCLRIFIFTHSQIISSNRQINMTSPLSALYSAQSLLNAGNLLFHSIKLLLNLTIFTITVLPLNCFLCNSIWMLKITCWSGMVAWNQGS